MASRIGANAPCPCGSGKKHKRCCGQGGERLVVKEPKPYRTLKAVIAVAVVAIVVVSVAFSIPDDPTENNVPASAPARQVWSAEHGHWHDIQTGVASN